MLGYSSEQALKNLLVTVGRGERDMEARRQRLCRIYDFSPVSAFERVDRNVMGRVNGCDLLNFLRDNSNYSATLSDCEQLVRFFDSDNDGVLSLAE